MSSEANAGIFTAGTFRAVVEVHNDTKKVAKQWYSILKRVPGNQPNNHVALLLFLPMFLLQLLK
jgi:hypothetical protein